MTWRGLNRERHVTAESSLWNLIHAGRPGEYERVQETASLDRPDSDDTPRPSASDEPLTAAPLPDPDGWTDPLSGANGPKYWERVVVNEEARRQRYGRTATVALVDLVGFEDERSFLSRELLRTLFTRVARVIVREVRTSDHVARIGAARFGILLVETDEVSAINFVDRLRQMLLVELGPDQYFTAHIGWASPGDGATIEDALATAADRLAMESPGR